MANVVVIGYGNDLRCDDGIGQRVAKGLNLANVKSLAVHQLTPELAETLKTADLAIFVDACLSLESLENLNVQVRWLEPENKIITGHTANPESLLALTQAIYGHYPPAWLVTVPGVNFELGENLSPIGERGVAGALEKIAQIVNEGIRRYKYMHEVGLMQNILNSAVDRAEQEGAHHIYMLEMRLGEAAGVAQESLEQAFEIVKKGTIADMAQLQIHHVSTVCYCSNCKIEFKPVSSLYECPQCHQPYCEIRQGKELEIASLSVS